MLVAAGRRFALSLLVATVLLASPAQSSSAGARPRNTGPLVHVGMTPKGWVPIAFGDGQISVPSDWLAYRWGGAVGIGGIPVASTGLVRITGPAGKAAEGAGPGDFGANQVFLSGTDVNTTSFPPWTPKEPATLRVNGFVVKRSGLSPSIYDVPSLGLGLYINGPLAERVLHTLTYSPRAVVLAPGRVRIPSSWRRILFDGLTARVPKQWPVTSGFPEPVTEASPSCAGEPLPLYWFSQPAVQLSAGNPTTSNACQVSPRWAFVQRPTDGLVIDGTVSSLIPPGIPLPPCLALHGLSVCPSPNAADVLIAEVEVPGRMPVGIGIGLSGDGRTAKAVYQSLSYS